MGELLTNLGFWVLALIVSAAMVVVFYEDIKTYMVDKKMVAWKLSKGYITDQQATDELEKAHSSFVRKMIVGSIFYYVAFFAILLGIGLIFLLLLGVGGIFGYRAVRWHPWHP